MMLKYIVVVVTVFIFSFKLFAAEVNFDRYFQSDSIITQTQETKKVHINNAWFGENSWSGGDLASVIFVLNVKGNKSKTLCRYRLDQSSGEKQPGKITFEPTLSMSRNKKGAVKKPADEKYCKSNVALRKVNIYAIHKKMMGIEAQFTDSNSYKAILKIGRNIPQHIVADDPSAEVAKSFGLTILPASAFSRLSSRSPTAWVQKEMINSPVPSPLKRVQPAAAGGIATKNGEYTGLILMEQRSGNQCSVELSSATIKDQGHILSFKGKLSRSDPKCDDLIANLSSIDLYAISSAMLGIQVNFKNETWLRGAFTHLRGRKLVVVDSKETRSYASLFSAPKLEKPESKAPNTKPSKAYNKAVTPKSVTYKKGSVSITASKPNSDSYYEKFNKDKSKIEYTISAQDSSRMRVASNRPEYTGRSLVVPYHKTKCLDKINIPVEFHYSLDSPGDKPNVDSLELDVFLTLLKTLILDICPSTKAIFVETKFKPLDKEKQHTDYRIAMRHSSQWQVEEGDAANISPEDFLVSMAHSVWFNLKPTVEVNVRGRCGDNPKVQLSDLSITTMKPMPTYDNYVAAAKKTAVQYLESCPNAKEINYFISSPPDNYTCGNSRDCWLTISNNALSEIASTSLKYTPGAKNGTPPGGFRKKTDAELKYEQTGFFKSYRAGVFYSALHDGDFDEAEHQDRLFQQAYRNIVRYGNPKFGSFEKNIDDLIDSLSVVAAGLIQYMLAYQDEFGACLGKDSETMSVTTSTQEYLEQDGFTFAVGGVETTTQYYRIPRKFVSSFEALIGPNLEAMAFIDQLVQGNSALSKRDAITGIRGIMNTHSCDSKEIHNLEKNMLKYWNEKRGPY